MKGPVPHLPDAGIGPPPDVADMIGDPSEDGAGVAIERALAFAVEPRRLEQRAVDVVLDLRQRAVADPDRARPSIAGERKLRSSVPTPPSRRYSTWSSGSVSAVACMNHQNSDRASAWHPSSHQRADHEVGIANPAEAVVPVARAADFLRQRRRRRGDGGAGRREDHHLQRERAPQDEVAPMGRRRRARADHCSQKRIVSSSRAATACAAGHDQRLGVRGRQREQRAAASLDLESPFHRAVAPRRRPGVPVRDRDRFGAPRRHRNAVAPLAPRRVSAVVEPRREPPPHRHRAGHAFDRPHQLPHRRQMMVGKRHRVDDADDAAIGGEGGFEDVGARQVAAGRVERNRGLQLEAAAAVSVEDGGEHARRVEVRQTQPVDRPVARDQRRRPAVADQGVVLDRSVAVDAHALGSSSSSIHEPIWSPTTFSKNRDRLLNADVSSSFFDAVVEQAREAGLLYDEHFTVDATVLEV